jgi:hypothetical protein
MTADPNRTRNSFSPLPLGEGPRVRGVASPATFEEANPGPNRFFHAPHPGPLPGGEGGRVARRRWAAIAVLTLLTASMALAAPPPVLPPGRQHRLAIEGQNTVTFNPRVGLPPSKFEYRLKGEYIVDARYGKESKPKAETDDDPEDVAPKQAASKKAAKSKVRKAAESPASKISGAIDLSLHAFERSYRQDGRLVMETRASRARFQGRVQPDAPVFDVSLKDAPPPLQEILKHFDVIAASLMLDDDLKVVDRRYRFDGPQRAIIETLLSIHTPIPRGVDSWESATQLLMGHGQTAKGRLRFEKQKPAETKLAVGEAKPAEGRASDLIKVKVSGVLKAEGVVAGNFIKDGTYTVSGEQVFDAHKHEWVSARWSVQVKNELANQAGQTVAHAEGTMTVESRAVEVGKPSDSGSDTPKL